MPRKGMRTQTAPDFVEGKTESEELQRRNRVAYHILKTEYDFAVTGGSGAGDILSDVAYRLLEELTVKVGGTTLHNVFGHTLGKIHKLFLPQELPQTDPTTDAAGTDEDDRISRILVPYFLPWSYTPDEFALPSWAADGIFSVKWASGEDLIDGEDGAVALDNVVTELFEVPTFGAPKDQERIGAMSIRKVRKEVNQDGGITVDLKHLTHGQELAFVIVEGMAKGTNDDEYLYNDSVVNDVGPLDIAADEEFEEVPFAELQARNKVEYQLSSTETGVAVLHAAEDKRTGPGDLWTVPKEGEKPFLELDCTAQTNDTQVVVTTLAVTRPQVRGGRRNGRR